MPTGVPGLLTPGNIDLTNRPRVQNADGSISTVRSIGVNIDGKEVLIPTVIGNRVVSNAEAIAEYKRTGKHLGVFDNPEHSTAYAQQLHNDQAQQLTMPEMRRVEFGGKIQEFPADATDAEISAVLNAIPAANAADVPKAQTWKESSVGSLPMAAAAGAVPLARNAAAELATNPNVPKMAASAGRVIGTVAPIVTGAISGSPMGAAGRALGAMVGTSAASRVARAGEKAGLTAGKLAQRVSGPVATALEAAAPYAQTLTTASGAQSALDLAQMAEPERKDIGFMGIGTKIDVKDPDTILKVVRASQSLGEAVQSLMQLGMPQGDAVRNVWNLKTKVGDALPWLKKAGK